MHVIHKFILIATVAILVPGVYARDISIEEALSCAQNHFTNREVDYFLIQEEASNSNVWQIFIDADPNANWEHEAYIITVPKSSIEEELNTSITKVSTPPDGLLKALDIKAPKSRVAYKSSLEKLMSNVKPKKNKYAENTYALIISGGINQNSNSIRYWNDCSYIYQTLTKVYNVPKDHIIPIMADGSNPYPDTRVAYTNGPEDYVSQNLDLDFDGEYEIELAATKSNIINTLRSMNEVIGKDSHLFIYVIDHGGADLYLDPKRPGDPFITPEGCYICLWNKGKLYTKELVNELIPLAGKGGIINIIMGQCHSGAFVDYLRKHPLNGVNIVSVCRKEESSYACVDIPYDQFVYHWTSAVNGITPYGESVNADFSGNGFISMLDAYKYAKGKVGNNKYIFDESTTEKSGIISNNGYAQISETPDSLSLPQSIIEDLAFDNIPEASMLYLKKYGSDKGRQVNGMDIGWGGESLAYLSKEEIDNFEGTSSLDKDCYVVKVHNRGRREYEKGDWISIYRLSSSTAYSSNDFIKTSNNESNSIYDRIGSYRIPDIPADSIWTLIVPNPFSTIYDAGISVDLLGCIGIAANIGSTESDSQQLSWSGYDHYMRNKSMAITNHIFVPNTHLGSEYSFKFANHENSDGFFTLELRPVEKSDTLLLDIARIRVKMNENMYKNWRNCGGRGNGLSPRLVFKSIDMTKPNASIDNLYLKDGQAEDISVKFCFTDADSISRIYKYDLIERDANGNITGGLRFSIQSPTLDSRITPQSIINSQNTDYGVELKVEPDKFETVNWIVGDGTMIDGQESIEGSYTQNSVIYDACCITPDGSFAKGSIDLSSVFGISSITKNGSEIKINLNKPAIDNSWIIVRPVSSAGILINKSIPTDNKTVQIDVKKLGKGVFVVSYYQNNDVVDSKCITL